MGEVISPTKGLGVLKKKKVTLTNEVYKLYIQREEFGQAMWLGDSLTNSN